jgi:hypothetical protein
VTGRRILLAPLAALTLAGCFLPQPLPDYPPGTVTPPRILADLVTVNGENVAGTPTIRVPAGCTGPAPTYTFGVQVLDSSNLEVEARWFIDYQPLQTASEPVAQSIVPGNPDPLVLVREVPPFTFRPYDLDRPPVEGKMHVVELVVSNSFAAPPETAALPWRSPAPDFETQVYRWTFQLVAGTDRCDGTIGSPAP